MPTSISINNIRKTKKMKMRMFSEILRGTLLMAFEIFIMVSIRRRLYYYWISTFFVFGSFFGGIFLTESISVEFCTIAKLVYTHY
jgi:hypothetical protein